MTETTLRFRLSDLKTIRIVCQDSKCGTVIELTPAKMAKGMEQAQCPGCHKELTFGREADEYQNFARAIRELESFQKHFAIELPFRVSPTETQQ